MTRLRLALDPALARERGPEIRWTWRQLLTVIGWPWEEVRVGDECDVAFVADPANGGGARVVVRADPEAWRRPGDLCLGGVRFDPPALAFDPSRENGASLVSAQEGRVVVRHDLVFDAFWLATGQEESRFPHDAHGFHDLTGSAWFRSGILREAVGSRIAAWLERALERVGLPAPVARWPAGRRAAAAISHDVDYPEVVRWLEPLRVIRRQGVHAARTALAVAAGRRHHWHFHDWIALEQGLGTRSAFYFTPVRGSLLGYAVGPPDPFYDIEAGHFRTLFATLTDAGVEVGLHASYEAHRDRSRFAEERARVARASGQPVAGNRHHYWHLDPADPDATLAIHERIGLLYDSSLIHNRYLGWRRGFCHPFFPFHRAERREIRTLQLPPGWMDDQLFGMRHDNPGDPAALLRDAAARVAEAGGALTVDVHDYVYDEALHPGWRDRLVELWQHLADRGDFWFATPLEIAEHWTARAGRLGDASTGLEEGST